MSSDRRLRWTTVIGVPVAVALLALVATTPLSLRAQALFGAVVFAAALVLSRRRGMTARLTLVLVSVAVSTRYLYWRITATIDGELAIDLVPALLLLGAELYTYVVLLLGYLQSTGPLRRPPVPLPPDRRQWPTVDVFIPTYDEPLEVVRATVLAARAMDWPADKLRIHLLDDGRREAFRDFAARAGVRYHTRPDNAHAKAGNLNAALARTDGDLVCIFDCDHIPTRSFLQVAAGGFLRDPKLALVQLPHHFYSPDPFERNLDTFRQVPNEGELFYGLIQPGNDLWNAAFFCGSCAVLRRSALESIGGFAVKTVTEDAHTALCLHRKGWRSAYLAIPQASGLATESLAAHVGQRIRWARGMVQIFRIDNPLLGRGLRLGQRLCYLAAMLYFFYGLPRLVFLTAPVAYLIFGAHIFDAAPAMVLAYALPHLSHQLLTNSRLQGRYRHSFWAEVYEAALAAYIVIPTTLALLAPRLGAFNVTAKGRNIERDHFDRRIAVPYLVLFTVDLVAFAAGIRLLALGTGEADVVLMNLAWCGYNLVVLGATLAVAWERRQVRRAWRVPLAQEAVLRLPGERTLAARTRDVSMGGASLDVSGPCPLEPGEPLSVGLFVHGLERALPARVVSNAGGRLRLRFDDLTPEQESWLVQALFSRADTWARWAEGRDADRPLRALGQVLSRAVGTVARVATLRRAPAG